MSEYLPKYDVWIQYEILPAAVNGFAVEKQGEKIAVINDGLNEREKIKAVAHEVRHHERGDLWEEKKSVRQMEKENAVLEKDAFGKMEVPIQSRREI